MEKCTENIFDRPAFIEQHEEASSVSPSRARQAEVRRLGNRSSMSDESKSLIGDCNRQLLSGCFVLR